MDSSMLSGNGTADGLQTLPPMPEPPIFDAPFNPYYGALSQALAGMNATQQLMFSPYIAAQILEASRKKSMDQSLIVIAGYGVVLLFSVVLLAYIRYNRNLALKGDSEASRKIILPAFEPLLWFLAVLSLAYVLFFSISIRSDFMTVKSTVFTIEIIYATKQFMYLLVPTYMLQKSLSVPALVRASCINALVSSYTVPVCWLLYKYTYENHGRIGYFTLFAVRWITFVPVVYYCVRPPSRASRHTIREYAFFYFMTHVLYLASCEAFRHGSVDGSMTLSWVTVCWNATCPLFIWRLLKADTEHWRGIGKRAVELQTRFRRKGRIDERISAKGLHVLIELHRKYIIDFAHLDIQQKISEAEHAMVFRGKIHSKQQAVAIKVYTPPTFDEDTVAEFSHEAALCSALRHPNIVTFHGMCVCPPTICLVTELCQGSLLEVTLAVAKQASVGGTGASPHRQQFLINIGYMLDAARAIAYLHSFSPAFVHRDIKPGSFLVDRDGSVKLTDFGASRALSARSASGHQHEQDAVVVDAISSTKTVLQSGASVSAATKKQVPPFSVVEVMGNLKGNPEYMAPEVIRGKHASTSKYGEAADIYALAMTMWDILYPGASKYVSSVATTVSNSDLNRRESEVFEGVFAGYRPPLDERIYPPLRELIQNAWHTDPRMRPSAAHIVSVLEQIQEEASAVYAAELIQALDCGLGAKPGHVQQPLDVTLSSFPGSRAIEKMYAMEHIATEHEAIRLGNMFMDAGFLHHIKHARSFEYSGALYYFDEEQISLCQPLAMLEEGAVSTEQEGEVEASGRRPRHAQQGRTRRTKRAARHSDASGSHHHHHAGHFGSSQAGSVMMASMACPCRKLGQKIETANTTRRRLRLKFKSSTDVNLVTARLLADENESGEFPDNAYNRMGRTA